MVLIFKFYQYNNVKLIPTLIKNRKATSKAHDVTYKTSATSTNLYNLKNFNFYNLYNFYNIY